MDNFIMFLLDKISPQIRELFVSFVKELTIRAAETPNPWDDIAVAILKTLTNIKD